MKMAAQRNRSPFTHGVGLLLAGLVVISLPFALGLSAAHSQLFSPQWVKELVTQEFMRSGALREVIAVSLVAEADAGQAGIEQLTSEMDSTELDRLAAVVVPHWWLEAQIAAGVDDVYAWLEGDRAVPEIALDLAPLRQYLFAEGGERAIDTVMSSWPPCTLSQLEFLVTEVLEADGSIPLVACLPPEPYQSLVKEGLVLAIRQEVGALPESQPLTGAVVGNADAGAEYGGLKLALRTMRWLGGWSWMVPAALLGLTMAIMVRSLRGWALWWGLPLLVGGVLSALLALGIQGPAQNLLMDVVAPFDAPGSFGAALEAVLLNLLESARRRWLISGMLVTGAGGVISLFGWYLPQRGS